MIMRAFALTTALVALVGTDAIAATPAQTISARQANFKQMGRGAKALKEELQKDAPSINVIRANAQLIIQAAPRVVGFFPRGTGPEAGAETKALPAIWKKNQKFRSDNNAMLNAVRGFQAAVGGNNISQIRAAYGALGRTCKACHDNFRTRD